MKKCLLLLIYIFAAVTFAACEKKETPVPDASPAPTTAAITAAPVIPAEDGFVYVHNGVRVVLGAPAADIIAGLGEPRSVREEPSCAFDGFDRTYIYTDFYVETFPIDDIDYISIINFRNDNVRTAEGLYIGAYTEDMTAVYGESYNREQGMYTYEKSGTQLAILIDDGVIVQITYYFMILD